MKLKLGLIGYPIGHSLSPWIHQQFMNKLGIDGEYVLYETAPENLGDTVKQLRTKGVHGFNITVPYKQQIIPYLDELDKDAEIIGAVNTVVNIDGKWKGYNTDGMGYVRSVKKAYPDLFSSTNQVLLLGAGGAARGIYRSLAQETFSSLDIANRTLDKAEELLQIKTEHTKSNIFSFEEAEERLGNYDFIVQTTSVGMKPNIDDQIISLKNLSPKTVVSDIVYQPLVTTLLKEADKRGGFIHQGHTMLLYQAQLAFNLWSDSLVPLDSILQQLEKRL